MEKFVKYILIAIGVAAIFAIAFLCPILINIAAVLLALIAICICMVLLEDREDYYF